MMDKKDKRGVTIGVHCAITLILWSIKNRGLELTLDELRRVCSKKELSTLNDKVYQGMLKIVEEYDKGKLIL